MFLLLRQIVLADLVFRVCGCCQLLAGDLMDSTIDAAKFVWPL